MEVNKTNVPEGQPSGILLFKGEVSNYVLRPVPKSQNPIFGKITRRWVILEMI